MGALSVMDSIAAPKIWILKWDSNLGNYPYVVSLVTGLLEKMGI